jgi:hypothetical protein
LAEAVEGVGGVGRVVGAADRLGVTIGAEALDFVKGQFRTGGDHQIVVGSEVPSFSSTRFSAGWTRAHPTLVKPMPFLAMTGGRCTRIASGSRQRTATHGLDGTNQ